jgi:type I restriction enzyme R subunit
VNAIVKDINLLKSLFQSKMKEKTAQYLAFIKHNFDDKDVDGLVEYFRDKERRKEFFKEYKEIEMLYEIISPDKFLRPFLDDYATLSAIHEVVRKAYAKKVYVDRLFQRKTNELVQKYIGSMPIPDVNQYLEIDSKTIEMVKDKKGGDTTKVINLIKSIEKAAEEQSDDPYLIAMAERARAVQENFENRQKDTAETLAELLREIEKNEARKKEQAEKGLDGLTFFVYRTLLDAGLKNAEDVSKKVKEAFIECSRWRKSEKELRELRQMMTFAICAEENNFYKVTQIVDTIIRLLEKAYKI